MTTDFRRRKQRRCRGCGEHIGDNVVPWIKVSLTGEESSWHPSCGRR